jgi:hypothetical protein
VNTDCWKGCDGCRIATRLLDLPLPRAKSVNAWDVEIDACPLHSPYTVSKSRGIRVRNLIITKSLKLFSNQSLKELVAGA